MPVLLLGSSLVPIAIFSRSAKGSRRMFLGPCLTCRKLSARFMPFAFSLVSSTNPSGFNTGIMVMVYSDSLAV
jgi:hypothetical protein